MNDVRCGESIAVSETKDIEESLSTGKTTDVVSTTVGSDVGFTSARAGNVESNISARAGRAGLTIVVPYSEIVWKSLKRNVKSAD